MNTETRPMKVVFIGNIPYDSTEESLLNLFREVGPVVAFRLVFDKDTGKPKGYGFCEYSDTETAKSCIRNLNNHEFNGRNLRVDFADSELGAPKDNFRKDNKRKDNFDNDNNNNNNNMNNDYNRMMHMNTQMTMPPPHDYYPHMHYPGTHPPMAPHGNAYRGGPSIMPPPGGHPYPPQYDYGPYRGHPDMNYRPLPQPSYDYNAYNMAQQNMPQNPVYQQQPHIINQGAQKVDNNINQKINTFANQQTGNSEQKITATLDTLSSEKLLSILNQTKTLIYNSPESARNLLKSNPQLAFALLKILLKLELVEPSIIDRIMTNCTSKNGNVPNGSRIADPRLSSNKTNKASSTSSTMTPEQQKDLVKQIMQLSQKQIDALPPDQREKVLLLKSQLQAKNRQA